MARRRRIEHFVTDDGVKFSFAPVGGGKVRMLIVTPGAAISVLVSLSAANLTDLGLLADTAIEKLEAAKPPVDGAGQVGELTVEGASQAP